MWGKVGTPYGSNWEWCACRGQKEMQRLGITRQKICKPVVLSRVFLMVVTKSCVVNPALVHCAETTVISFFWSLDVTRRNKESWNNQHAIMFLSLAVVVASTDRVFVIFDILTLAHQGAGWSVPSPFLCLSGAHWTGIRLLPCFQGERSCLLAQSPRCMPWAALPRFHRNAMEAFRAPSRHFPLENITSKWGSWNHPCLFIPVNTVLKERNSLK